VSERAKSAATASRAGMPVPEPLRHWTDLLTPSAAELARWGL
jgi:hypothetical protein